LKEPLLLLLNNLKERLSADEIEALVRAFVIVVVTLILAFIVMEAMPPIDQAKWHNF
jgi:hypothetical protein